VQESEYYFLLEPVGILSTWSIHGQETSKTERPRPRAGVHGKWAITPIQYLGGR